MIVARRIIDTSQQAAGSTAAGVGDYEDRLMATQDKATQHNIQYRKEVPYASDKHPARASLLIITSGSGAQPGWRRHTERMDADGMDASAPAGPTRARPDRLLLWMVLFYVLLTLAGLTLHFLSTPTSDSANSGARFREQPTSIVAGGGTGRFVRVSVPTTNTGDETLKP